ncbi:MAG: hypothetical protein WCO35_02205 [Candidatus Nomurabacteria bacterium]
MSYKKRNKKENIINRLNKFIRLIKIVLLKKYYKLKQKRRSKMKQIVTRNLMSFMRQEAKLIRQNNQKIDEWVESYIDECILYGKPVEILTQWCLTKGLEDRFKNQGNKFEPLKTELDLFDFQIPKIIKAFKTNNVSLNWFITFNDSFIEKGIVDKEISKKYINMLKDLSVGIKELLLLNWEEDVLMSRPKANKEVLENFDSLIPEQAFDIAMDDLVKRTENSPDFDLIKTNFREGLMFKISCEAEEGRCLMEDSLGFLEKPGNFLLLPLEYSERYVFFNVLTPNFSKRIVSVLKPYPWRS